MRRREFLVQAPLATVALASSSNSPLLAQQSNDYFPPPDQQGGWRVLADPTTVRGTAGMDSAALDQAFEYTKTTSRFGGLLVARHGYLVYEKYFGRAS